MLSGWKQIADYLHVSVRTLKRWEKKLGKIPVWKVGNKILIDEDELIKWIKENSKTERIREKIREAKQKEYTNEYTGDNDIIYRIKIETDES
jgi:excisionase family DNA binding protein